MTENPYASPTSAPHADQKSPEADHATRLAALGAGAWRGAKRGFLIVASLAASIGAVAYTTVYLFGDRTSLRETPMQALMLLPVAACMYGVCGAAIGATITGTIAALRFETRESMSSNSHQRQSSTPPDRPDAI